MNRSENQSESFPYGAWDTVYGCWLDDNEFVILPSGQICRVANKSHAGEYGDYHWVPILANYYGIIAPSTTIVLRRKDSDTES